MIALIIFLIIMEQIITILLLVLLNRKIHITIPDATQREDAKRYIEMLIETVYTYKHDPSHLIEHLLEEMTVDKLLCYHVVNDDFRGLFPPDFIHNKRDMLIYKLTEEGYSPKVLCQLFGLSSISSVYVKCCRVRKKLLPHQDEKDKPE